MIKTIDFKHTKASCFLLFMLALPFSYGQFAGSVGQSNSTAVHKDSSLIIAWATACTVERGYFDIAAPHLGVASTGLEAFALGPADGSGVVSLGDSGVAILTFDHPIFNGAGPDFAVFENAFSDSFLELGFVEVSSDGQNYFRFPAVSNQDIDVQIGPWDELGEASKIYNLAGKYRGSYGTPFDLEELQNTVGLNVNAITHIKIIDVIGSLDPQYASLDKNGNPINDPYPTAFESGGFDLDAVGVCYQQGINSVGEHTTNDVMIFPNPFDDKFTISKGTMPISKIKIYNMSGKLVQTTKESTVYLDNCEKGIYLLEIEFENGLLHFKRVVKR